MNIDRLIKLKSELLVEVNEPKATGGKGRRQYVGDMIVLISTIEKLNKDSETLEALRWADKRRSMAGCCDDCPVMPSCLHEVNYAWCERPFVHRAEWLTAYRKEPERQKIANAIDEASDALGRVIDGRLERARKEQETS